MSKLIWTKPSENNLPPEDKEILVRFKHGIVSAYWDYETYKKDGTFCFTTYIWTDIEGFIYEFISMDAFNSVFVTKNKENEK